MRKPVFVENAVYHIFNRGVDKRTVFMDDRDYLRFLLQLYELNDEDAVVNLNYYYNPKTRAVESRPLQKVIKLRKRLVDILVFTLMPNHYHLMLRQKAENGITRFMQKLGTGYTMYFNKKNKRTGSLFQGRFKAIHLTDNAHLIYLPHYIHTNPLSLNYGGSTSIDFLEKYRWSSFLDYVGVDNFPSITERPFLLEIFGGESMYRLHTENCLKNLSKEEIAGKVEGAILK
jgi:putative transposase